MSNLKSMESLPTYVWPLFLQGEMFVVQRIQHCLTSSSNRHVCGMGRIVEVVYDKAIAHVDWASHGAKTIKKTTNSTQNKYQTHRAKQYEVTSFLSTDCELSTETCSKNVYSLGPWCVQPQFNGIPFNIHCFCKVRCLWCNEFNMV